MTEKKTKKVVFGKKPILPTTPPPPKKKVSSSVNPYQIADRTLADAFRGGQTKKAVKRLLYKLVDDVTSLVKRG